MYNIPPRASTTRAVRWVPSEKSSYRSSLLLTKLIDNFLELMTGIWPTLIGRVGLGLWQRTKPVLLNWKTEVVCVQSFIKSRFHLVIAWVGVVSNKEYYYVLH